MPANAERDALFADLIMVDRGVIVPQPGAPRAKTKVPSRRARRAGSVGREADEALAKKLVADLERILRRDADQSADVSALAAVLAGVAAGQSVVLRLNPELSDNRWEAVKTFLEKVFSVTKTLDANRQEAAIAKLAEVILPDDLASARGTLAADNLALRDRFIAETSPLMSADVAAQAGHRSRNRYATAARWKSSGDIFSVHHRGTDYYPSFQFRDGRPHPTIKNALAALPSGFSPWQRAFWFVSTNGWLDDRTPADMLDDADAVVAAARREAEEVVG